MSTNITMLSKNEKNLSIDIGASFIHVYLTSMDYNNIKEWELLQTEIGDYIDNCKREILKFVSYHPTSVADMKIATTEVDDLMDSLDMHITNHTKTTMILRNFDDYKIEIS